LLGGCRGHVSYPQEFSSYDVLHIFLMALKFCIIFSILSAFKTPGLYTV